MAGFVRRSSKTTAEKNANRSKLIMENNIILFPKVSLRAVTRHLDLDRSSRSLMQESLAVKYNSQVRLIDVGWFLHAAIVSGSKNGLPMGSRSRSPVQGGPSGCVSPAIFTQGDLGRDWLSVSQRAPGRRRPLSLGGSRSSAEPPSKLCIHNAEKPTFLCLSKGSQRCCIRESAVGRLLSKGAKVNWNYERQVDKRLE